MKALHRHVLTIVGLLSGLALSGSFAALGAQGRGAMIEAPRLMVPTFGSGDKKLGIEIAENLRERLQREIPIRQLWVIPANDINGTLVNSGFDTSTALNPADLKELAKQIRADEILSGVITRTPSGVRVNARLMLPRDLRLVQPLPVVESNKAGDAARQVARHALAARKQLASYKKCEDALRAKNWNAAVTAAREGIAAYAQATLPRICALSAYVEQKAPGDTIVKYADEILALDPRSGIPLAVAAQAYQDLSSNATDEARRDQLEEKAVSMWTRLLETDPSNTRLQEQVTAEIARLGKAAVALPIIDNAIAQNPDDVSLIRLGWLIHLAARDYKGGVELGERLVRLDTAAANADYFTRQTAAYASDSQPQRAAEMAARGVAKYPNNADLVATYATALKQAGQLQQAHDQLRKAIALNPKLQHGYVQIAQIHLDLNEPDSAVVSLVQAVQTQNDDATFVGSYALSQGNAFFKKANGSKKREDFQIAMKFLALADSLAPSPQAKFLLGISAFSVGQSAATDAPKTKSCDLARLGQTSFATAESNITAGRETAPDAAKQYLDYLKQFKPAVTQQVKTFCK